MFVLLVRNVVEMLEAPAVEPVPACHLTLSAVAQPLTLLRLLLCCRFPYPSVSEIMGLSSQTKFSEEQIKVWFSAQRLKHGVSWTPEEVGASSEASERVSSDFNLLS